MTTCIHYLYMSINQVDFRSIQIMYTCFHVYIICTLILEDYNLFLCIQNVYIESCIHYVYRKGFKIGIQNVYMILNAENVKCIHFVYIIVYIIYTAMYTLCTFSCIHFVCITSVRVDSAAPYYQSGLGNRLCYEITFNDYD